jgi:hypothetical protein
MAEHGDGKLIPPRDVFAQELEDRLEERCAPSSPSASCARPILKVAEALEEVERPSGEALARWTRRLVKDAPKKEWRAVVETVVAGLAREKPKRGGRLTPRSAQ